MRVIGRRVERVEREEAERMKKEAAEAVTGAHTDPRGHVMSLITRQNRESLQRAAVWVGGRGRGYGGVDIGSGVGVGVGGSLLRG